MSNSQELIDFFEIKIREIKLCGMAGFFSTDLEKIERTIEILKECKGDVINIE